MTGFIVAGITGSQLAKRFGVRQLVIAGMASLGLGVLWLTRVPVGASYVTDILPAFLIAGVAIGLAGPSVQIGALSGVAEKEFGLASGLVETMREIGDGVITAAVSTVLVSRLVDASSIADSAARQLAVIHAFRVAFVVIVIAAVLGVLISSFAFSSGRVIEAPEFDGEVEPALNT